MSDASDDEHIPLHSRGTNTAARRRRPDNTLRRLLRPRVVLSLLKVVVPVVVLSIVLGLYYWEPHIEISFYNRDWVSREVLAVPPLAGCFAQSRVSPSYNVTHALYAPKSTEVHPGIALQFGMDCYNFAGTIPPLSKPAPPQSIPPDDRVQFHTYWRTDLASFGPRQEWMLKSFFATQDLSRTRLILWSNGDLSQNEILQKWLRRFPDAFTLRVVDYHTLARGTELEGSELLNVNDTKAWIDGDLVRLLVIWAFGGVWIDMDSLLTRDLTPLLEHEFVTQWDCYDKKYSPMNGALMRFHKHSPYLCEAFHVMVTSPPPRQGTTDWGALLYLKLFRRLLAENIPPFKVLPFCFSDARSCRLDNRLPDPFVSDPSNGKWTMGYGRGEGGRLDKALKDVFSVHLHNQWSKPFPKDGWVERLLLRRYDERIGSMES
ncbi:glycosyltransferase family 32 protein [Trametes elegans]|nr:glycosyltransferase family 32 protein [Trametes elegans]